MICEALRTPDRRVRQSALRPELAIKLFATFPVVAFQLSNKILELTGLGADLGKAQGSGPTPNQSRSSDGRPARAISV